MMAFFLLVAVLSVPFALLGSVSTVQLSPGIPVSALGFICPVTAALVLTYREGGAAAAAALLKRSFDYRRTRAKAWYVPVVLVMPCITILTYAVARSSGFVLPTPRFTGATIVMSVVFFIAALGEELGWSGHAIDPMQERWGPFRAAILLGAIWAIWHIVAMLQAGQSPTWRLVSRRADHERDHRRCGRARHDNVETSNVARLGRA
jgi:membrane protease YdiL (CAAX protease family)